MTYLLATVASVAAIYFIAGSVLPHKLRAKRFSERESMSFEDIYEQGLRARGVSFESARQIWVEAAARLHVDPMKLRCSDRFDAELSHVLRGFPYVDLNDEFYWWTVDAMRRRAMNSEVFEQAKTFGDYVAAFADKRPS